MTKLGALPRKSIARINSRVKYPIGYFLPNVTFVIPFLPVPAGNLGGKTAQFTRVPTLRPHGAQKVQKTGLVPNHNDLPIRAHGAEGNLSVAVIGRQALATGQIP